MICRRVVCGITHPCMSHLDHVIVRKWSITANDAFRRAIPFSSTARPLPSPWPTSSVPLHPENSDKAMRQAKSLEEIWQKTKAKYPGCLVMMQIGDFFEMWHEDARESSKVLDIKLTKRTIRKPFGGGGERKVDMSGFPVHATRNHLPKLARAGFKVVIVEQDKAPPSTPVRASSDAFSPKTTTRTVARVVTPGTLYEDELLRPGQNNFLLAINASSWSPSDKHTVGVAWGDVSTGELFVRSMAVEDVQEHVQRLGPSEIVLPDNVGKVRPPALDWLFRQSEMSFSSSAMLTFVEKAFFSEQETAQPRNPKLKTDGPSLSALEANTVAGLRSYVASTLRPNFEWAVPRSANNKSLMMDFSTRHALEITGGNHSRMSSHYGGELSSLYGEVKYTVTAMGARLLRSRLEAPSLDVKEIDGRLDAVDFLVKNHSTLIGPLQTLLRIKDPARAFQRLRVGRGSLVDLVDVHHALDRSRTIADEALPPSDSMGHILLKCSDVLSLSNLDSEYVQEGLDLVNRVLTGTVIKRGRQILNGGDVINLVSSKNFRMKNLSEFLIELDRALLTPKHYSPVESLSSSAVASSLPVIDSEDEDDTDDAIIDDDNADTSSPELEGAGARLFRQDFSPLYDELFNETTGTNSAHVMTLQARYRSSYHPKIKIVPMGNGKRRPSSQSASSAQTRAGPVLYVVEAPRNVADILPTSIFAQFQDLKHKKRFMTAELSEINTRVASAGSVLAQTEKVIIDYLLGHAISLGLELEKVFDCIAQLDVACSSAKAAVDRNLVRPKLVKGGVDQVPKKRTRTASLKSLVLDTETVGGKQMTNPKLNDLDTADGVLDIRGVRHLTVERNNANFVRNDALVVAGGNPSLWLITGPNMGGKSTFLRSCASIVILAQAGLFVPASEANLGLVDRIFARIGASDDIARNRSTFMVEMEETAQFLSHATKNSLVIVDELGRGTSPSEGMAIAQACLEELVRIGSRSLFATHFHELASAGDDDIFARQPGAVKRMMAELIVNNDRVTFTYRIKEGAARTSDGLNVAEMAGIPKRVLDRAKALLEKSQSQSKDVVNPVVLESTTKMRARSSRKVATGV